MKIVNDAAGYAGKYYKNPDLAINEILGFVCDNIPGAHDVDGAAYTDAMAMLEERGLNAEYVILAGHRRNVNSGRRQGFDIPKRFIFKYTEELRDMLFMNTCINPAEEINFALRWAPSLKLRDLKVMEAFAKYGIGPNLADAVSRKDTNGQMTKCALYADYQKGFIGFDIHEHPRYRLRPDIEDVSEEMKKGRWSRIGKFEDLVPTGAMGIGGAFYLLRGKKFSMAGASKEFGPICSELVSRCLEDKFAIEVCDGAPNITSDEAIRGLIRHNLGRHYEEAEAFFNGSFT